MNIKTSKLLIALTFIVFFLIFCLPNFMYADVPDSPYMSWLENRCEIHEVPFEIALAVAMVESNFTMVESAPNRNGTTDIGIFQLNSNFVEWFEEALWYECRPFNPYDPKNNIEMGVIYLRHLYDQTGDWDLAVRAYNTGLHALLHDPDRSKNYLVKVINTLVELGI